MSSSTDEGPAHECTCCLTLKCAQKEEPEELWPGAAKTAMAALEKADAARSRSRTPAPGAAGAAGADHGAAGAARDRDGIDGAAGATRDRDGIDGAADADGRDASMVAWQQWYDSVHGQGLSTPAWFLRSQAYLWR